MFTPTLEENNTINYLDLMIHRTTHGLQLGIYRKPTNTDTTIHFNSTHSIQNKLAAYRFYINRLLTLPITNTEKNKEWHTIQCIAHNNGFPPNLMQKLRYQREKSLGTIVEQPINRSWVTFTFSNPAVYKITNLFKNTGLNIAFRPSNTVWHQLQPKQNYNPNTQSGIYQLQCGTCNKLYVGQSGRAIDVRYKEHIPTDVTIIPLLHTLNTFLITVMNLDQHTPHFKYLNPVQKVN
jgi:hypothetical protein